EARARPGRRSRPVPRRSWPAGRRPGHPGRRAVPARPRCALGRLPVAGPPLARGSGARGRAGHPGRRRVRRAAGRRRTLAALLGRRGVPRRRDPAARRRAPARPPLDRAAAPSAREHTGNLVL
ncbi:MAG: hypothetical protein AVDCRST_MAG13-3648, partial [uncultured Solirubrobacteraceae bacterium]